MIDDVEEAGVIKAVPEAYGCDGSALAELREKPADGGGFVVRAENMPEAASASAAQARGFNGENQGRYARRIGDNKWLVKLALAGQHRLFQGQRAPFGDLVVGHLREAAHRAGGLGRGATERFQQDGVGHPKVGADAVVPIDGSAVFDDEGPGDTETKAPPDRFGARFAGTEDDRNLTPSQRFEGVARGFEAVGVVIEQCAIEIRDDREMHPKLMVQRIGQPGKRLK